MFAFFQTCNCVSFCPVPAATPTKSITNEGQTVATVHPQPSPAETAIQPSHCVAGYSDGTIRIFDLGKVEMIMKMQPHGASITTISFSADGKDATQSFCHQPKQVLPKKDVEELRVETENNYSDGRINLAHWYLIYLPKPFYYIDELLWKYFLLSFY